MLPEDSKQVDTCVTRRWVNGVALSFGRVNAQVRYRRYNQERK